MTFKDLQNVSGRVRSAIWLEHFASRRVRRIIKKILLLFLPVIIVIFLFFAEETAFGAEKLYGTFLAVLLVWAIVFMLDAFFYSIYFEGIKTTLREFRFSGKRPKAPFELLFITLGSDEKDVTEGFIKSQFGRNLFARLGLAASETQRFLNERSASLPGENLILPEEPTLASYAGAIYDADPELARFLSSRALTREHFVGASDWIARADERGKAYLRWWSRDSLGRIRGIGKEWAHGETFHMDKYGNYLSPEDLPSNEELYRREVDALEAILSRAKDANALLVGNDQNELLEVIGHLARRIADGSVLPQIEHKKVFLLNASSLLSATDSKTDLERELLTILREADNAEHIIFVIPAIAGFIKEAEFHGVELLELLGEFLRSSSLQIIALSDRGAFMDSLQKNTELMNRFEKILLSGQERGALVHALEERILKIERRAKLFFTYPALLALADASERFFSDSAVMDKAGDMISEIVALAVSGKKKIITKEDVAALVKMKTGIPSGAISLEERKKLINLEKVLHERIVGQDAAIKVIAGAMRRARSGIASEKRPLGSFLFLGPTGVGKTETTKALAEAFFGAESKILRFDMSEYNSPEALARLIGSFEGEKSGTLSSALRDRPYGVLLLDEFEKADKKVIDLFLQILDEGFFSDMRGERVNARNLIIIATSNAASDMIWNIAKAGKNPNDSREEIIDAIVKQGIFKPELLNRFDGIIFFHPLAREHLEKIARLLLGRLEGRLKEKGIEFVINNELVQFLVSRGSDPKFGARPLNRAIQDEIEKVVAERIISGEIKAGARVELHESDLT